MLINAIVDKLQKNLIVEIVDSKNGNIWMEYTVEEIQNDNLVKGILIKEIGVHDSHLRIIV